MESLPDIIEQPNNTKLDISSQPSNLIEEAACCRVCHEGSVNDGIHSTLGPLYHPCKCDGSIKYVHQECLIQWLKISNKESNPKCELCGENFHFDNIYENDTSPSFLLTLKDTLIELFPRFMSLCTHVLHLTIICILLLACLPLFCHGITQYCWCIVSEINPERCTLSYISSLSTVPSLSTLLTNEANYNSSIENISKINYTSAIVNISSTLIEQQQLDKPQLGIEHWWLYWYSGVVDISLIIGLTLLLHEIWQVIYKEYRASENMYQLDLLREKVKNSSIRLHEIHHHRIDDFKVEKERLMFAIEDFRAVFIEWKNYKESCKRNPSYSSELFRYNNIRYTQRIIDNLEHISKLSTNTNFYNVLKKEYTHLKSIIETTCSIKKNSDDVIELNNINSPPSDSKDYKKLINEMDTILKKANELNNTRSSKQFALLGDIIEYTRMNSDMHNIIPSHESDNITNLGTIPSHESDNITNLGIIPSQPNQIMTDNFIAEFDGSEVSKYLSDTASNQTSNNIETVSDINVFEFHSVTSKDDYIDNVMPIPNENEEYGKINLHNMLESSSPSILDKDVFTSNKGLDDINKEPSLVHKTNDTIMELTQLPNYLTLPIHNEEQGEEVVVLDLPNPAAADLEIDPNLALVPQQNRIPDHNINANDRITMNFALTSALLCFAYVTAFVCVVIILPVLISRGVLFLTYQSEAINNIINSKVMKLLENDKHVYRLLKWFEQDTLLLSKTSSGKTIVPPVPLDIKQLVIDRFTMKMKAGVDILIGYMCYISVLMLMYLYACFRYIHRKQFSSIQFSQICTMFAIGMCNTINTIIKMKLLLLMYILVIPALSTKLILICMHKNLPETLHIERIFFDDQQMFQSNHVILLFSLFIISHLMMMHTRYLTFELRQLIDLKYLKGVLPDVNIFDNDLEVPRHLATMKEKLERTSYVQLLKMLLIDTSFLLVNLIATVILPLRIGHIAFPFVDRLQLRIKPIAIDLEVPVEMVVCHVLLPTLLERLNYRKGVKAILLNYIKLLGTGLDLKWIGSLEVFPPPVVLVAEEEEELNVPQGIPVVDTIQNMSNEIPTISELDSTNVSNAAIDVHAVNNHNPDINESIHNDIQLLTTNGTSKSTLPIKVEADTILSSIIKQLQNLPASLRLFILVYLGIITISVISSWFLYCPLTIGRYMVSQVMQVSDDNDVFNYPIGFAICWMAVFILNYMIQDLMKRQIDLYVAMEVIMKWLIITSKVFIVGLYSLTILPLMSGYIIEQLIVIPLKGVTGGGFSAGDSKQISTTILYYNILESWVFGLIALKLWSKFVLIGAFGEIDIRNHLEIALIRGVAQFDAYTCIRNIILPITLKLFEYCFIPYIISFILISYSSEDHHNYWIELLITWNYHFYIILKLMFSITIKGIKYIKNIYKKIHDSKYLIGTKLTNRNENI